MNGLMNVYVVQYNTNKTENKCRYLGIYNNGTWIDWQPPCLHNEAKMHEKVKKKNIQE